MLGAVFVSAKKAWDGVISAMKLEQYHCSKWGGVLGREDCDSCIVSSDCSAGAVDAGRLQVGNVEKSFKHITKITGR
jgi:hypothetical protein